VELPDFIGFFVNMLVLRTDLSGNPTFREVLGRVREVVLESYAHQDVSFEQVVEALQLEPDPSRHPLFQVMFVLETALLETVELRGLRLSSLEVDIGTAKVDLTLSMEDTMQELKGWVEYNTDLFDATTIARLVEHWQMLLEGIVADPQQRLCELQILMATKRQQLLVEWNATSAAYPKERCIH